MPARRDWTRWRDSLPRCMVARWLVFMALSLSCLVSWADEPNDVVLIAHPNVRVETLSRDTARAIFAMRQRTWPNGQSASVFVLPEDHPVHARFSKSLLNVYPHQLRLAWDRVVFSGTGQAPNVVMSQPDMIKHVASTPGGLGYIERGYLDDSVNVIPIVN